MSYYKNKKWNDVEVTDTKISGARVIHTPTWYEYRGRITTTYHSDYYDSLLPDGVNFKHDKYSHSYKNVLRGLHYDDVTWKLVSCVYGRIMLVIKDMRMPNGEEDNFILSPETGIQVLIPPSVANGHLCLSNECIFTYKMAYPNNYVDDTNQKTLPWYNTNTDWPIHKPILSVRDM